MENNEKNNQKLREFLHTLDRLNDRVKMVIRGTSRIANESSEIKQDILELQEDVVSWQRAFESFCNDIFKERIE